MNDEMARIREHRKFGPHLLLSDAAKHSLDRAEEKKDGYIHDLLAAMTRLALALEAMANSFGKVLLKTEQWPEFEKRCPRMKIEEVCKILNISVVWQDKPWNFARWLLCFRNSIAHAKFEKIDDSRTLPLKACGNLKKNKPASKLEKKVTFGNAKRAVETVRSIMYMLCERLPADKKIDGLFADGWFRNVSWTSKRPLDL